MSVHSITFSQSCWTAIRSQTQQTITTFLACSSALLPASWLCGMWLPLGPLTNASDTCRRCCRRRRRRCCRCCFSGFRGGIEPPPTQHTTQPSCAHTHVHTQNTVSVYILYRCLCVADMDCAATIAPLALLLLPMSICATVVMPCVCVCVLFAHRRVRLCLLLLHHIQFQQPLLQQQQQAASCTWLRVVVFVAAAVVIVGPSIGSQPTRPKTIVYSSFAQKCERTPHALNACDLERAHAGMNNLLPNHGMSDWKTEDLAHGVRAFVL